MSEPTVAQRLGYPADAKLLIINADDLGSCHSANVGVFECLATCTVTSATLMVPCPWAREASSRYRGEDIGVHLTLNAEYELYRWGPITHAPSLLGGDGGFPRTVEDVWDHADLDEVRRECRAQIERAILWGFDVSHIDAHMGTLQLRPEFFDVYLDMAVEFGLPLRMMSSGMEKYAGFPARAVAAEAGAIFTDHMRMVPGVGSRQMFEQDLKTLRPGVTEMHLHPAVDSAELRSLATDDWEDRVDDHRMICDEHWVGEAIKSAGATLIGFVPYATWLVPEAEHVPETTMQGVSLHSKDRRKTTDVFELALTYDGIEIRRPGEEARHLSWDRITEWEIEQRRGGVLLTLRGGGSVTPLVIPRWKVDDLDLVLRDVTSHIGESEPAPEHLPPIPAAPAAPAAPPVVRTPPPAAPAARPAMPTPPPVVRTPPPAAAPVVAQTPPPVVPTPAPFVPEPKLDLERSLEIELELEPEPEPILDDVIAQVFAAPPGDKPSAAPEVAAAVASSTSDQGVDSALAWPERDPLGSVPDLQWPGGAQGQEQAPPIDVGFMGQHGEDSPLSASATLARNDEFVLPTPQAAAVSWAPDDADASTGSWSAPLATAMSRSHRTARRRRQGLPRIPAQAVATVLLLGGLAFAVAMVLAQSAGAIHLGFLGPIA